jgi:two-component system sensor histidine kinase YesM
LKAMYKRTRQHYLNLPIRYKIMLWFVPLLIITITITGITSFQIASKEITDKMEVEQLTKAKQAIDHLDYIAADAIDISNYLFLTPEIQSLLRPQSNGGGYITNQSVIDSINRLMVTRPYFQFLTLYSEHFAPLQFNNKGLSSAISFEEFDQKYNYQKVLNNPNVNSWSVEIPGGKKGIFYGDSKIKLLLTKVLKNTDNYNPEGIILLGIDEMDIRSSYSPSAGSTQIVVYTTDGNVLSDSSGKYIGSNVSSLPYYKGTINDPMQVDSRIDTSKWLFAHVESSLTGWHILVIQPRSELLAQLHRITYITAMIICITIVIALILSWAVSGVIISPIRTILTSMKRFQKGNFHEHVILEGHDELGQFGAGYNIMVQRIRELVDDVYSFELKQKQAELKVLQSQINPHFLYNTLNTIAWTAEKNGDRQVGEMIYALSGIFKLSLNQGRDVIELQQEFKLLEHYLYLQKMRFPNKLTYELELAAGLETFQVPKLLLQPLVENAVIHGIEPLIDELGIIAVRATAADDNQIEIEITDNGVGMPVERLQEVLLMCSSSSSDSESFALFNVYNRIRMFYGDRMTFIVDSVPGSGTRITLTIPDNRR